MTRRDPFAGPALLLLLASLPLLPGIGHAQPYETEAMARDRAAAGDPEGDPIDFADAELHARHMVYRRDVELFAGRPHAEAARVMAAELIDVYYFPMSPDPFAAGLDQSAFTPAMAEALPIAIEGYRAGGDLREVERLQAMRARVVALDDVPRWALRCREGLLGLHRDPTPCEMLAQAHAVAHGRAAERVTRLEGFARAIAAGRRPQGPPRAPHFELDDRLRATAHNAALALDAFDRQLAAGLTPIEAAVVLSRWDAGELNLTDLGPPVPADAGAWSTTVAEGVVLRTWLARHRPADHDTYGSLPPLANPRPGARAAFGALPLWSAIDPPGAAADLPALAARCRHARIEAALDPAGRGAHPRADRLADCRALADLLAVAAGPFDPQVNALRRAAGEPADARLAALHRPPLDDREGSMSLMLYEFGGLALSWDAEVAVGTPVEQVPGVLARYRVVDIERGLGRYLVGPAPDGGAWMPALIDGVAAAVIGGQIEGDPVLGIGGLDAWSAILSGPRGGPEFDDVPALALRCRAGLVRWQLGQVAPDPHACVALADGLEVGAGGLDPDVVGARLRALALGGDEPGLRAELQAALDDPWADPTAPETIRARARLAALGHPDATLYREEFVEFFDVDSEELLDEWARDLAAGLDSERATVAVARRADRWVQTVAAALQPPFPADAGAWPQPMVEGIVSVVEIGARTGRGHWALGLQPALSRAADAAEPLADIPALAIRCRTDEIRAMDDRPAIDVEACERLFFAHGAMLGAAHPLLTDARLRLARLHASRGERAAALDYSAEAVALWTDPVAVDSTDEAVWAASRALRRWGHALAAVGQGSRALEVLTEGRLLAATNDFARAGDGLRYLGEEARVAADGGSLQTVARLLLAIRDESQAVERRMLARDAAGDLELDEAWGDGEALALAGAQMSLDMGDALERVLPPENRPATLEFVESGWRQLLEAGLSDHPLAVELLAVLARLRARFGGAEGQGQGFEAARASLALQARLDRRERPWMAPMAAAEVARSADRLDVAIAWAKEAVDVAQAARAEVGALGAEAEQRFVEARVELYTRLAGWLIEAGRLAEADEVEKRVGQLALAGLSRASRVDVAREPVSRSAPEDVWRRGYAAAVQRLRAGRIDEARFARAIAQADARLDRKTRANARLPGAGSADDRDAEAKLLARLERLGRVALLQIVLGPERTHLVLSTPAGRQTMVRAVGAGVLNGLAHDFYRALKSGASLVEVDRHGERLYAHLLAPVAAALDAQGVEVLMVAPGGALRYVPFGALKAPGGRYAVEARAIVRYPVVAPELLDGSPRRPACLGASGSAPGRADCIAAFGAQQHGGDLSDLTFVPPELEGIVRRRIGDLDGRVWGAVHLDDAFTADALQRALSGGVPLVHIASHFVFHPGSATRSFLALGGGARLELQRLQGADYPFAAVDLLTLSACETAVGTFAAGQPPDSFSAMALSRGAGAVLASLWSVPDDSTATLMQAFYRHLAGGASKAEALRSAQLELMGGPAPAGSTRKFGLPGAQVSTGAHPYAWAPFVLTGDWR